MSEGELRDAVNSEAVEALKGIYVSYEYVKILSNII